MEIFYSFQSVEHSNSSHSNNWNDCWSETLTDYDGWVNSNTAMNMTIAHNVNTFLLYRFKILMHAQEEYFYQMNFKLHEGNLSHISCFSKDIYLFNVFYQR